MVDKQKNAEINIEINIFFDIFEMSLSVGHCLRGVVSQLPK